MSDAPVVFQSFGACRTVTGSRHVLHFGRSSVLLDCGLVQGPRREAEERNRHLGLPGSVKAVVLSHAHIDHSGALPSLVRDGYGGRIHATPATRDLCRAMLADSAHLNEADARYLNKRRDPALPPIEPLYREEDVDRALKRFRTHPYDETFDVIKQVKATFRDAGHILGSAGVLLERDDGFRIYFTGDLGRRAYPILRDPEPLPKADVILSEATYGLRNHQPVEDAEETLVEVLDRVQRTRGKVFVPAFSVGRTQNLVYALAKLRLRKAIPDIPIFVDSPLARKATAAFVNHPECYDEETKDFIGEGGDPFHPHGVHYVESRELSKALNDQKGPFVVIAGSGMCEGGRIVHHLLHGIDDDRNVVLFVGYAAPSTLARRIMDGQTTVRILGRKREVRARVEHIGAFSSHADRNDLLRYLAPAAAWGSTILLVHGDVEACLGLAQALRKRGHERVLVPEAYASYPLTRAGERLAAG